VTPGCLVWTCLLGSASPNTNLDRGIEPLPSKDDGVYGRFESDLDLAVGSGMSWIDERSAIAVRSSLHYVWTAGIYVSAGFPLAGEGDGTTLSFGVDLRPAFLPRFSENLEQGPAFLDLWLDSISLSLGPHFDLGEDARGLDAQLGSALPLFGTSVGPWFEVRGLGRFPDGDDASFGGMLLLVWHQGFRSPLVRGDPPPQFAHR
jgi:hypothetical protein